MIIILRLLIHYCLPVSNKPTFANGNTSVTTQNAGGSYFGGTSSLGMVGGKWYCEFKASSLTGNGMVGIQGNPTEQARDGATDRLLPSILVMPI